MYRALFPALISAFLLACAHTPIRTLSPLSAQGDWKSGIFLMRSELPSSQVQAGFAGYAKDGYSFETLIQNDGGLAVELNPVDIRCRELDAGGTPVREMSAIDPEQKLAELTRSIQSYEEEPVGLALLSIAGNVSSLVDHPDTAEEWNQRQEDEAEEARIETQVAIEISNLKQEKAKYAEQMLRRHALAPGDLVAGRVTCPGVHDATARLELVIPVGPEQHRFAWDISQRR